jgi:hypothetical protein
MVNECYGAAMERHLHEVHPADQVTRWEQVAARYPEATYSLSRGWFYGALRPEDKVFRASSLRRLIDALLSRENETPDTTA